MDNKIYFVCSKYTVLLEIVLMGNPAVLHCEPWHGFTKRQSGNLVCPTPTELASCTQCNVQELVIFFFFLFFLSCLDAIITLQLDFFVDILQLLSGCMYPMLNFTGSIDCQFYVTFTSVRVCKCPCLFFMKSLTHDFDYIDNFVTFLFYVGRSHQLREKQLQK